MTKEEAIVILSHDKEQIDYPHGAYGIALDMAIKALQKDEKVGHWIDKDEKTAVCSCCNRNNVLYGDFCKWCGTKMKSEE